MFMLHEYWMSWEDEINNEAEEEEDECKKEKADEKRRIRAIRKEKPYFMYIKSQNKKTKIKSGISEHISPWSIWVFKRPGRAKKLRTHSLTNLFLFHYINVQGSKAREQNKDTFIVEKIYFFVE